MRNIEVAKAQLDVALGPSGEGSARTKGLWRAVVEVSWRRFAEFVSLVNNAGIAVTGPVEELPLAEFRRVMETNYFGALRCIQAVVRGMRERRSGHIINVSWVQGRISIPSYAAYAAAKWALEAASEALAQEAKSFGIKVHRD